ncbi:hypothetical protein A2U01_0043786 [Trifolium medium]|uniref:Uncharacterized protein n=1 Tax=Trifolium medium TaxID=97028 RepID=A0A392QFU6_9FABA|nr:hypothetical protein [Trifolium medium]
MHFQEGAIEGYTLARRIQPERERNHSSFDSFESHLFFIQFFLLIQRTAEQNRSSFDFPQILPSILGFELFEEESEERK